MHILLEDLCANVILSPFAAFFTFKGMKSALAGKKKIETQTHQQKTRGGGQGKGYGLFHRGRSQPLLPLRWVPSPIWIVWCARNGVFFEHGQPVMVSWVSRSFFWVPILSDLGAVKELMCIFLDLSRILLDFGGTRRPSYIWSCLLRLPSWLCLICSCFCPAKGEVTIVFGTCCIVVAAFFSISIYAKISGGVWGFCASPCLSSKALVVWR